MKCHRMMAALALASWDCGFHWDRLPALLSSVGDIGHGFSASCVRVWGRFSPTVWSGIETSK